MILVHLYVMSLLCLHSIIIFHFNTKSARKVIFRAPTVSSIFKHIFSQFFSETFTMAVHRVPFHTLWIGVWMTGVRPAGFPHSDICGSMDICSSPQLFAAYHVFLRLLVPRHPPCALSCLTSYLAVFHSVEIQGLAFLKRGW